MANFWDNVAFLVNRLIFILIGAREPGQSFAPVLVSARVAALLSIVGRATAIYPVAWLLARTPLAMPGRYMHVLVRGGLRGAPALAALPEREAIITTAFAVVALSIVIQGLRMPPLLRPLGLTDDSDDITPRPAPAPGRP